jgi:micrococcal nuclease
MIVAGLYYLTALLTLAGSFGIMLFLLSIPFIIFSIISLFGKRQKDGAARSSLIALVIAIAAFVAGIALTPGSDGQNLQSERQSNPSASAGDNNNGTNISPAPTSAASSTSTQASSQTTAPDAAPGTSSDPGTAAGQRQKAKVARVVDGDTFEIEGGRKVRLIGVDTPESVHPDPARNTEFGKTASAFTRNRLEGKDVYLEKDVSETDKYGRLLRYAYLADGTFFNELLVSEGMANPATFPPDVKYADVFVKAQQYARDNNKGLWAFDDQPAKATPTPVPKTDSGTGGQSGGKRYVDANGNGLIKGNINSKKEKIYHLPGGQFYDRTIAEEWFKTEEEAKAAGYRRSLR